MVRRIVKIRDDRTDATWKVARIVAGVIVGAAAAAGLTVWMARDQMARNQRELFSPLPLRRLAALGYLKAHPDVDNVLLLRDYLAWEEKPLLRKRATAILAGMEEDLAELEEA
ncbi:MAG: hypothetical protein RRA92_04315 [Gemmatimonadota bacterium]|nr:hypothetical protein [Gemmatimonadota bacterium]